jgi:hypothetical protein
MSTVTVKGLDALTQRLAAAGAPEPLQRTLRDEAEAIAEAARRGAPGQLGETVEVVEQSRETRLAYAIGTAHPAGRFLEYGTVKLAARPWLWPVFHARSPGVKHKLGRLIAASLKRRRGAP